MKSKILSDQDLENFKNFIEKNRGLLTSVGVFGALMSFLVLNQGSLPFGTFLPFLSTIIFFVFIYSFIRSILKLKDDKKGDYLIFLQYLLIIFSALLIFYTLNAYSNISLAMIQLGVVVGSLLVAAKIYEKYQKQLNENKILTFFTFLIIFLISRKIDQCGFFGLDKEGISYMAINFLTLFVFLFLILFPFFVIISNLWEKIKRNYKQIIKSVIISGLLIGLIIFILFIIGELIKFNINLYIVQSLGSIKEIVIEISTVKWCQ